VTQAPQANSEATEKDVSADLENYEMVSIYRLHEEDQERLLLTHRA